MKIKAADLLFVRNQHDDLDEAIAAATGDYIHVGIALDNYSVIHASGRYGVVVQSLTEFIENSGHADIYRPMTNQVDRVISQVQAFEGLPYNFSFYPDGPGLHCSQLVALAFKGVITFNEQPMQFGDGQHDISDFWLNYYFKLGLAVPLNQPGTNPTDMSHSDQLEYIGRI